MRVISWNLFHGRDHPPDPALSSWRSRLLRITERSDRDAQVNRDLYRQFAALIDAAPWDVALLQECPPRWAERLGTDCAAHTHRVLTARNPPLIAPLQALAAGFNPDLIASWEGGSNLTLVRARDARTSAIVEREELTLTRRPETRRMVLSRLSTGVCIANLHASEARQSAEREIEAAAAAAVEFADGDPLLLGGDFNLRPASSPATFAALQSEHGLEGPTAAETIDHLLGRGMDRTEPSTPWPLSRRQTDDPTAARAGDGPPITLSDHSPVESAFEIPDPG